MQLKIFKIKKGKKKTHYTCKTTLIKPSTCEYVSFLTINLRVFPDYTGLGSWAGFLAVLFSERNIISSAFNSPIFGCTGQFLTISSIFRFSSLEIFIKFLYPFVKKKAIHSTICLRSLSIRETFRIFKPPWFNHFLNYDSGICSCHPCKPQLHLLTISTLFSFWVLGFFNEAL